MKKTRIYRLIKVDLSLYLFTHFILLFGFPFLVFNFTIEISEKLLILLVVLGYFMAECVTSLLFKHKFFVKIENNSFVFSNNIAFNETITIDLDELEKWNINNVDRLLINYLNFT